MILDLSPTWQMPGITVAYADVVSACAGICLSHHGHGNPVELRLDGDMPQAITLGWSQAAADDIACYGTATDSDVIRYGAECAAVRVVAVLLGLQVIKKAAKGTGVDFWLGDPDVQYSGYEGLVRLEVSGILEDNEGEYRRRLREKLAQMAPTDPLPGYAAIVMFGTPKANVTERR